MRARTVQMTESGFVGMIRDNRLGSDSFQAAMLPQAVMVADLMGCEEA